MKSAAKHLLVYEPRTEGHHLGWLRFIVEDLLSANYQISLAVDLRPAARAKLDDHLSGLIGQTQLLSAYDSTGRRHGDGKAGSIAFCLRQSAAEHVFLAAFDEIASTCWRRATFGLRPPVELHGHMGGIYHRPRFLTAPWWSPNRLLKSMGFRKLLGEGWLRQLLLVDEYLVQSLRNAFPGMPLFFLPDPCRDGFARDSATARRQLGVPLDKRVLLFFGTGQKRKGLHLAVEALRGIPADKSPFLLCAGQLNAPGQTARDLDALAREGRALVLDRYVSAEEEKLCFAAADVVLLPYLHHFGTSGVLSNAMAAGKMVIASDEQLVGRLTREQGLGLLFQPGNVAQLRERMLQAAEMSAAEMARWCAASRSYVGRYSRGAFRKALLDSLASSEPTAIPPTC